MVWRRGEVVVRREVWHGRPWVGTPVYVVHDDSDLLATYLPEGAPFGFPAGDWPTPTGQHPWFGRGAWEGHGVLMLQRPGESYAVWHFWEGDARDFAGWYVNLQEPFRRTTLGYDTQDLELDVWIPAEGAWSFKDDELLEQRGREGRFTSAEVAEIRVLGAEIGAMIDSARTWWNQGWSTWEPDSGWVTPSLPDRWELAETLE
jgi:hypothetical protein